jgi:hypothetical protein
LAQAQRAGSRVGPDAAALVARVASLARHVRAFESDSLQAEARRLISWAAVDAYAAEEDAGRGKSPGEYVGRAALAKGLMRWFKNDFFQWTNKPSCPNPGCGRGGSHQELVGMLPPTPDERDGGWASAVEGYTCKACATGHRFPRYNNPAVLLQTRRGRCGEWANCFTLVCRAAGFEARHVTDWTDHVWTEVRLTLDFFCEGNKKNAPLLRTPHALRVGALQVWIDDAESESAGRTSSGAEGAAAGNSSSSSSSTSQAASRPGRWFHADPCENKLNRPRLYERGWHKQLTYAFAAAKDHVVDVAPRYTER